MSVISEEQGLMERIRELEAELSYCRARLRSEIKDRKQVEERLRQSRETYADLLEGIAEGYLEIDMGGYITAFNSAMCDISGRRPDQLKGLHYREYTTPESAARLYRVFSSVFQTGRPERIDDYEIIRKDGTRRLLQLSTSLRRNPKGRPLGFMVAASDVTGQRAAEAALRRKEKAYRLIAENGSDVVETFSLDNRFTFTSPSVERLRGWSVEETLTQRLSDVLPPESQKQVARTIAEELSREGRENADPRRSRRLELTMRHKNGTLLTTETLLSFVRDESGAPVKLLWVCRDISGRKSRREELAFLLYRDPLTGLFNRKGFMERLEESITYAARYNMERAILHIDLNRFKEVNDQWGNDAGDRLLLAVAKRLRRTLRNTDIVSRLGGDEFTVILNNPVDLYPELAAANLLNTLSLSYDLAEGAVDFITPSIGVSLFPWDGRDGETLMRKADAAMRRGKHRLKTLGGTDPAGSVHFYEEMVSRRRMSAGVGG